MSEIAIYPGTFDPVTNGHLDIIKRSRKLFSRIIVAVAESSAKNPMFSFSSRVEMLECAIKSDGLDNVEIKPFSNLLVDFAKENNSHIIIRGLRAVSDFEYELQMGYAYASLSSELEMIYLMPSLKHAFISSSIVRSILHHSFDIAHLVPPSVFEYIKSTQNREI